MRPHAALPPRPPAPTAANDNVPGAAEPDADPRFAALVLLGAWAAAMLGYLWITGVGGGSALG